MGQDQVATAGPVELRWDADARSAVLRFVEPGTGGKHEAQTLTARLQDWVGEDPEPYELLVDCSDLVDADASWRSIWADHFRSHSDRATLAWFNANARVRLIVIMFLKGTGVHGQPFETEHEARSWLAEQRSGR